MGIPANTPLAQVPALVRRLEAEVETSGPPEAKHRRIQIVELDGVRTTTYDEQYDKTYSSDDDMILEEELEKEDSLEEAMNRDESPKYGYDIDEPNLRRKVEVEDLDYTQAVAGIAGEIRNLESFEVFKPTCVVEIVRSFFGTRATFS